MKKSKPRSYERKSYDRTFKQEVADVYLNNPEREIKDIEREYGLSPGSVCRFCHQVGVPMKRISQKHKREVLEASNGTGGALADLKALRARKQADFEALPAVRKLREDISAIDKAMDMLIGFQRFGGLATANGNGSNGTNGAPANQYEGKTQLEICREYLASKPDRSATEKEMADVIRAAGMTKKDISERNLQTAVYLQMRKHPSEFERTAPLTWTLKGA